MPINHLPKKIPTRMAMLILMAALIALTFTWRVYSAQQQASPQLQPLAVTTAEAQFAKKSSVLKLTATMEGIRSAIISSRFAGKIDQIMVEDGQAVEKGAPLLTLDMVELSNAVRIAQNNVRQTEANFRTAQADYQRYNNLYGRNAVTKQQLESAEARMITTRAEMDSAYANLNNTEKQISDGTITSPVTGVVANKSATIGQNIAPGTPLLSIEQIDQVYAVVQVEQKDIAAAQPGTQGTITLDAYPSQIFSGTIAVVNPVAGSDNRMFRVKIRVDNPKQLLKPGMFAQVSLNTGEPQQVLAVPRAAILQQKGLYYVYAAINGHAKKLLVEPGDLLENLIEIKKGLQPGMEIITDNLDKLKDGDPLLTERSQ